MNLAYRDIKHNLLRFVLTCVGLSLLLGIVITMTGIYRGALDDAVRLVRATSPDLWIVEAGTNGPFAESSRIAGDTREMVARVYGVERAGSVTYQSAQDSGSRCSATTFRRWFRVGASRRSPHSHRRTRNRAQPLRDDCGQLLRSQTGRRSAAGYARTQIHRRRPISGRGHVGGGSRRIRHAARCSGAPV